jgi:hypothetical protein
MRKRKQKVEDEDGELHACGDRGIVRGELQ